MARHPARVAIYPGSSGARLGRVQVRHEAHQGSDGYLAQAAALEAEPVVESGVAYCQAVEQIALVEFGSPAQLLDRGRGRQFLERSYVCRND